MDKLWVYKKVKRKKIIQYYLICTFLFNGILTAQVKLDGQFFDYATYYISNIDLSTGQSDVPLYRYRIYIHILFMQKFGLKHQSYHQH